MSHIEISSQSFDSKFTKSFDVQFRSLEKGLEKLKRDYCVNDFSKIVIVTVDNKMDAISLAERLCLNTVLYSENGVTENLQIKVIKKVGRPKNIVRVSWVDKSMSAKQVNKFSLEELQRTHILKVQIIKSKLITKTQLEKYIAEGKLEEVSFANKIFIERESFIKLLK